MKVLVTGGAGFIGANFVQMAMRGDFPEIQEIIVVDKLTYAGNLENLGSFRDRKNFLFLQGDIADKSLIADILPKVDCIINFAAESHVDRSIADAGVFVTSNVLGVQNILGALIKMPDKRFLQVSTDEVYGSIESGSWDESEPLKPNSPYSASKAGADLLTRSYFQTFGLNVVITRCSNNYGPMQFPEKLIPVAIKSVMLDKKIPIYGSGLNSRDWLYVNDHCRGIYLALLKGEVGETYNIGGGAEKTNLELARNILDLMGADENQIQFVPDRLGHDLRYSVNWKKIELLGYEPTLNFHEGLEKTIQWYKANPRFLGLN